MKPVSHSDLVALLRPHDPPCISLHVPMDARDGAAAAAVKLANAVRSVRPRLDALDGPARAEAGRRLDEMVGRLAEAPWEPSDGAWRAATRGVALFVSPTFSAMHRLAGPPAELSACDAHFHARPVLEQHSADLQYHLLTIHRDEVRLFAGCAERLDALPTGDIPVTQEQAVGVVDEDARGGRDEEKDRSRFLMRIGHALPRGIGDAGSPPLVVMAVEKNLGTFRKLHPNIHVAEGGLAVDPRGRTSQDLHSRSWDALQPLREGRVAAAIESIDAALPRARASKDLAVVAKAAVAGRVATLLLAVGRRDAGRLDESTGELRLDGPGHDGPDVLEQVAAAVLLNRGEVLLAPPELLHSHAAALFRY